MASTVDQLLGRKGHRGPDVAVRCREMKAARQHADDSMLFVVEQNLAADHFSIRTKPPRPQFVGDERDVLKTGTVLFGRECPPQLRRDAEDGEEIVSGLFALQSLW